MKLLTVAIPCYNSQDYMEKCIDSLLIGGEDVEIIIVDDGSKDMTPEIADSYAKKHPEIVRAIHQENGGHGEAVNTGIRNAQGNFFKVVDSDDWVDAEAYQKILATLRELVGNGSQLDMLISNFVYEKKGQNIKSDEIYFGNSKGKAVYLERCAAFFKGTVYSDALGDLPYTAFERLWTGAAKTYVLCG